jgi:hypothetical protein
MELALTVLLWLIVGIIGLSILGWLVQVAIVLFIARKANKELKNHTKGWRF